jgi:plastocyanin
MKKFARTLGIVVLSLGLAAAGRAAGFEELAANAWSTTLAALRLQKTAQEPALPVASPRATDRIVDVAITGMLFVPAAVTIEKGDWIRWTNNDRSPHTATGKGRVFDTGTIVGGKNGQVQFNEEGTFAYHCTYHTRMAGTIVVK